MIDASSRRKVLAGEVVKFQLKKQHIELNKYWRNKKKKLPNWKCNQKN